jgi:hypothetical protein
VLESLGYPAEDLDALERDGAIAGPPEAKETLT